MTRWLFDIWKNPTNFYTFREAGNTSYLLFLILTKFFFLHFAFCLEDLSGSSTIDEEMEKDIKSRVVILLRPHHIWAHRIISILIQTGTKTIPLHQKCISNHKSDTVWRWLLKYFCAQGDMRLYLLFSLSALILSCRRVMKNAGLSVTAAAWVHSSSGNLSNIICTVAGSPTNQGGN